MLYQKDLDNRADTLDVRDLIERLEELESDREPFLDAIKELEQELADADAEADHNEIAERLAEARKELNDGIDEAEFQSLQSLLNELKGSGGDHQWRGDWYPVTLVRDSYWKDYAQEYADDVCGEAIREARWPCNYIDWDRAADELQMDYSSASFDGVDYWYR